MGGSSFLKSAPHFFVFFLEIQKSHPTHVSGSPKKAESHIEAPNDARCSLRNVHASSCSRCKLGQEQDAQSHARSSLG